MHGNFASPRWWRPLVERLPKKYVAHAPATRGFGPDDPPAKEVSISGLAKDLEAYRAEHAIRSFHLVGHSLGAAIALQYALDFPERLLSLVLVSPAPATGLRGLREGPSRSARSLRMLDRFGQAGQATLFASLKMGRIFGTDRLMLKDALGAMMPTVRKDQPAFHDLVDDAARIAPETVLGFYRALDDWSAEEELGRIRGPVLIVWGTLDAVVPRGPVEAMVAALPHARLEVLPSIGHSPQIEDPDRLIELIHAFFEGQRLWPRIKAWLLRTFGAIRSSLARAR